MNVGFKNSRHSSILSRPSAAIDLRTYLNFVWRNWMFIGAVTALALLVAVVYLARATPLYTATAQILLDRNTKKLQAWMPSATIPRIRQLFVSWKTS